MIIYFNFSREKQTTYCHPFYDRITNIGNQANLGQDMLKEQSGQNPQTQNKELAMVVPFN